MRRHGISFTLTIVVAGVILLMTALSVITLGGSSISDFFGTAGEQQTSALVRQECADIARQVSQNYCSQYIVEERYDAELGQWNSTWEGASLGDCDDTTPNRHLRSDSASHGDPYAPNTAGDRSCAWEGNAGSFAGGDVSPVVTVRGSEYNCLDEGHIPPTCPVQ